jgi:hypothetical protein
MGTPHVHAEVIKAWADGAAVEMLHTGGKWGACGKPMWLTNCSYRVKPDTIRYRVALMGRSPVVATYGEYALTLSSLTTFNRWLTDWVEVEV